MFFDFTSDPYQVVQREATESGIIVMKMPACPRVGETITVDGWGYRFKGQVLKVDHHFVHDLDNNWGIWVLVDDRAGQPLHIMQQPEILTKAKGGN